MIAAKVKLYAGDGHLIGAQPCIFSKWVNIQSVGIACAFRPIRMGIEVDGKEIPGNVSELPDFTPGAVVHFPPGAICVSFD
jgi:hypothetical protein